MSTAQPVWTAPPEPPVPPQLPEVAEMDTDGNRIDDLIDQRAADLLDELRRAVAPSEIAEINRRLAEPVRIELVFESQVTQEQIDDFLAMGGEIEHVYRAVSYGWTAILPRAAIEALPAAMGPSLLLVVEDRPVEPMLDEATRTGRVRPVWQTGFAGSGSGFQGDNNITIAILDTGIDASHVDLSGRMQYWKDYTADAEPMPLDIGQHGSHVAGIALGTGASFGSTTGTLLYTDSGDLTPVSSGSFFPSPMHLPSVPLTFTSIAEWFGGGTATLHTVRQADGGGSGYTSVGSNSGTSPLSRVFMGTPLAGTHHSAALLQNGAMSISLYAVANSVTDYPAVGDGFNTLQGACPSCWWAGAKVFTNTGSGSSLDINAAMDDMVVKRAAHNIKVANMSLGIIGSPGINTTMRAKANTMVDNGIVVAVSAGNSGPGTAGANLIGDPGRAAKVLTVAASNDINELTEYTSSGFLSPGPSEDHKPDVMAPGGSRFYSHILSVDSNDADAKSASFADLVPDDYLNIRGTSMASPFAAGAAALVIDALQQNGLTWSFTSSAHSLLVKMLLCASATESNADREAGTGFDPTLGRATAPKDRFEGYGLINPDAAIEAASLVYTGGALSDSTAGGRFDRRAWGREISVDLGSVVSLALSMDPTADFDIYLYRGTPDAKGNPVILAAGTNAGLGAGESIDFTATAAGSAYLFIKRVSGSGAWDLSGSVSEGISGDHYVGFKMKASKIGAANIFPTNWNIMLNDAHLNDVDADDPENYVVKKEITLLNPAMKNTEPGPSDPELHYIRYQIKESAEGAGPEVGGKFPKAVKHQRRRWDIANQFGTLVLESLKVNSLWVPAGKDESSAATPPASDETHFKCYKVKPLRGASSDQTPEAPIGSGKTKFRSDLQAFFLDQFDDCALNANGGIGFQGTAVEGKCLYDLKKPVEVCSPAAKDEVGPGRQTAATITGSTPSTTASYVCYQAKLATKVSSSSAAALLGVGVGQKLTVKQSKHVKRILKNGTQVFTAPGNLFPAPTQVDTSKTEMVCVPSAVAAVSPL